MVSICNNLIDKKLYISYILIEVIYAARQADKSYLCEPSQILETSFV